MNMAISRQKNEFLNQFSAFNSQFHKVEISDDFQRAIITIPLMHEGPNKKGLYWTAKMLKEIVPLFRSIPFRYDIDGQEGSSHATRKLSSPHFDVGWTNSDETGAWYDSKTKTLWVQGEVTHPDVIAKLSRKTTDGKREVNYASMGVIVDDASCSICGAEWVHDQNNCKNGHERLNEYDNETCYKVPTECSKGLHAALTNDPADGEAEITNCVFQDLYPIDKFQSKPNTTPSEQQIVPTEVKQATGGQYSTDDKSNPHQEGGIYNFQNQYNEGTTNSSGYEVQRVNGEQNDQYGSPTNTMPNGMTGGEVGGPQFKGPAPSPDTILKDLAERIKTVENKLGNFQGPGGESPELVNANPQDNLSQDNMGVTEQFKGNDAIGRPTQGKPQEDMKMDVKDAQNSNEKVPVNPKPETQEAMNDPMSGIMQMLQEILNRLPNPVETQDMGKEAQSASKGQMKPVQSDIPTDHQGDGDSVGEDTDEGAKKNRANMNSPGKVATADNAEEEPAKEPADEPVEDKEKEDLKSEVADLKSGMTKILSRMEAADNIVPEFGAGTSQKVDVEAADMSANDRHDKFGDFGKWDACFNGTKSASRFGGK